MTVRVLGIDLSLTACGVCVLPDNWAAGGVCDWSAVRTCTFGRALPKDATETERAKRLEYLTDCVANCALDLSADVAVFEQYAFNQRGAQGRAVAEAGGCMRLELHRHGFELHVVVVTAARKTFLGELPRSKDTQKPAVQAQLRDMGAPFWRRPDECDAFVIANHFLSEQGFQFVGVKGAA